MPYSGPNDKTLPANVEALSSDLRALWVDVFNAVHEETGDEGQAAASAWTAVGKVRKNAEADIVRGIELFRFGPIEHPVGDFVVDAKFAEEMLEAFRRMTERGYHPPILAEHEADGTILGIVRNLRVIDEAIVADLEFAEGIVAEFDAGRRRYFSPSFYETWVDPHSGEEWRNVLREISVVSVPHLKNTVPYSTHYSLNEHGFATEVLTMAEQLTIDAEDAEEAPAVETQEEEEDRLAMVLDHLALLEERIEKLEGGSGDEKEEEMTENAELRRALDHAIAINAIREELPTASREVVEDLASIRLLDEEIFGRQLSQFRELASRPTGTKEIGYIGATPSPMTFARALEMAEEHGVPRGVDRINWVSKNFPNVTGD